VAGHPSAGESDPISGLPIPLLALQRTAWLLTGDWALAEDLVQTALIRSWPRWERITRRDDPEIYVLRVTPKRHEQSGSAE
jgi:Sigma-70 region 2